MDYNDPRIEKLKAFLYKKKLGVWTIKDILSEVMELFDDNSHRQK